MPNHVEQKLTIVGPDDAVRAFVDKARGSMPIPGPGAGYTEEQRLKPRPVEALSFHAIVPLPDDYSTVDYSRAGQDMERAAWGTKWGPYHVQEPVVGRGRATYEFTCAWSPPITWLEKASASWPMLDFFLSWGGEGPTRGRTRLYRGSCVEYLSRPWALDKRFFPKSSDPQWEKYADGHKWAGELNEAGEEAYGRASNAVEQHYIRTHDAWVASELSNRGAS